MKTEKLHQVIQESLSSVGSVIHIFGPPTITYDLLPIELPSSVQSAIRVKESGLAVVVTNLRDISIQIMIVFAELSKSSETSLGWVAFVTGLSTDKQEFILSSLCEKGTSFNSVPVSPLPITTGLSKTLNLLFVMMYYEMIVGGHDYFIEAKWNTIPLPQKTL